MPWFGTHEEDELEKAFEEQDTNKTGKISLPQCEKALKALGKDDEQVATLMTNLKGEEKKDVEEQPKRKTMYSRLMGKVTGGTPEPPEEITFDEFRALAQESKFPYAKHVDDTYIVGAFSCSFADAFGWYAHGKAPSEEKLKAAFEKVDTDKDGTLDKGEVARAFRALNRSERQIQKIVDAMPENAINFEEFKAIIYPETRPYATNENGYVPVPNREKLLDVPVLGHTMSWMGHLMCEPIDHIGRKLHKRREMTDEMLEKAFKELDTDKDGRIDKKQIETGLREKGGKTEVEIMEILDNMKTTTMSCYMFKAAMRGPKFTQSSLNYVPAVGESLSTNVVGADNYEEEDLKEAFDHIREIYYDNSDTIDKTGLSRVLYELGMSDHMVQQIADGTIEDAFDFEGFKEAITPKGREWTTESGYPNPAVVHDVPILGTMTKATQDAAVGTYHWTAGAAVKHFKKPPPEELKAKWEDVAKGASGLAILDFCKVLRNIGEFEKMIIATWDSLPKEVKTVIYEDFNKIVQGENPSWVKE